MAELSSSEAAPSAEADPSAPDRSSADILDSREAGGLIIRGGGLRFGGYVGVVAMSVLSASLLTRHLGPVRFGQYTTVLSLVAVFAAITDAGMSAIGTREYAVREGPAREELMRDLLGLRMLLTLVGVACVLAFALGAGYDPALLGGAVLASLGTVALVVQHTYTIPLTASLRLGVLTALELARQALTVAAIVALIVGGSGVLPLLAVSLVVNLLLIPPTAALARGQISLRMTFHLRRFAGMLRLTLAFSVATAVGTLYVYTAQILTSLVASPHQSGLFAASFRIFIVAAAVPGLLVSSALPLLARSARDDRERLGYALQRIFEVCLILGVAAGVTMLSAAAFVIRVIAGSHYAGAVEPLQILGVGMIASFLLAGWSYALLSLERYRELLLVNLCALLTSCLLTALLASSNGASGAAVASVCGETILAAGLLAALVRRRRELRPKLSVLPKVVLAAAPAAACALLTSVPSLPRAVLAFAIYGLVILALRAVPAELLELLPGRLRRGS